MNFLKLKDAANKLLEFMEKYNLDDYNETLVRKFLKELIYVIDTDEMDNVKKYQEVKKIIVGLYPPRGGLTEMYVADEDREKMNKINCELKELKKKITLLD